MGKSEQTGLEDVREWGRRRHAEVSAPQGASLGARAADWVAGTVGSWSFILIQSTLLCGWLAWNVAGGHAFDPYPFILLNLMLSFQAAYTAPIIMMSQNRQGDVDRARSIDDYAINRQAELEIAALHQKIDLLRAQEIAHLSAAIDRLAGMIEQGSAKA